MAALHILFGRRAMRRERVFRDRNNPMDYMTDMELVQRFRFTRHSIYMEDLVDQIAPMIERPTGRSSAIPVHLQVLVTLRFLAKGDYQSETADLHVISTASCSRIIHTVCVNCGAINRTIDNIKFPPADMRRVKEGFHSIAQFPNVIGAIDGTLIPIQGLSGAEEPNFVCREGYHAINVQAVADHNLRFTNIVVRWPGGTHDAFILQQSALYRYMEANQGQGWLLGDSGYPLKVWLITPLGNPSTPQEERFQKAHCKTRNVVERAFGVLKQRFRCLHKTGGALSYKPERSTGIIEACFRLHNKAVDENIPINRDDPLPILNNNHVHQEQNIAAQAIRNQIIQRFHV